MQSIDNNIMSCLTMQSFAVVCSYDRCTMMQQTKVDAVVGLDIVEVVARCEMRDASSATCHGGRGQS